MDNLRQFNLELDRAARELTEVQFLKLHRWLALLALRKVVLRTPVDTGRTRGNWQATNDAPAFADVNLAPDRSGARTIRAGMSSIAAIKPFSSWWLSNNLAHILVLDEGGFVPANPGESEDPRRDRKGRILVAGGYSLQAPAGIVGPVMDELERTIATA